MGWFAKDMCEDGMRHLCLNALGRNSIISHCLGGTGSSSTKGGRLAGFVNNTDDGNEKSTGHSIPGLGVCGNVGNGHAADDGNGTFDCWFGCKFKADFH